jgi:hypothetical protein
MRTIFELLQHAYPNDTENDTNKLIQRAKAGEVNLGIIWERVCSEHLGFDRLRPNAAWMDHKDGSDSKFASVVRMNNRRNASNCFQATFSTRNKIGYLRICMWNPITDLLYYMLVPYEYYVKFKGNPMKITFQAFNPKGVHWDQYQCDFKTVTGKVADNSKQVYNTNIRQLNGKFIAQA